MRFVIVGSGWRSLYYVRIARALPEKFELCAMLCRTKEKAERIAKGHGIYTTTSIEECREMKPDFVVVAVDKASIARVSIEWMDYGFAVLCETPAGVELLDLNALWRFHEQGKKLVVAEQYMYYPRYYAMLKVLRENLIGEPYNVNVSLAHEYHGASLIRAFLEEEAGTPFTVSGKTYTFPTCETLNRYERFLDGRVSNKNRVVATFEFEDGKTAWYDFNSEQYRSTIRNNFVKAEGQKGQLMNDRVNFLGDDFLDWSGVFRTVENHVVTGNPNPNLYRVNEIEKIVFCREKKDVYGKVIDSGETVVYEAYFGKCGLGEDETAIAKVMEQTYEYAVNPAQEVLKRQTDALRNALQDAYMALLMQQALDTGKQIVSERQVWQG
ncbi:MAG: Gfo/Idh/MocA family oxidoreductase [Roseburia sp.]|nr:Gfo/Idh/MocA family oxidoreductase [Roseburia sp.]